VDGAAAPGRPHRRTAQSQLRADDAAFAANWRTVIVVDLAMAVAVLAGGLVLLWSGSDWGWALLATGFVYTFFAFGRVVKWRRLRRQAGL
jgi:hypothetical protein